MGNGKTIRKKSGRNTSGLKRGGSPGRPKGVPNKVTTEAREAANALVDDPVYREKLLKDLRERRLAPAIEAMLWYYAKGKPKETIEHQGDVVATFTIKLDAPTEVE